MTNLTQGPETKDEEVARYKRGVFSDDPAVYDESGNRVDAVKLLNGLTSEIEALRKQLTTDKSDAIREAVLDTITKLGWKDSAHYLVVEFINRLHGYADKLKSGE